MEQDPREAIGGYIRRKQVISRNRPDASRLFCLIFALWATTQHYADFGVQVQAITGRALDDPAFFEETVENVQRIVLQGIAAS